jgi:hypothetical protein
MAASSTGGCGTPSSSASAARIASSATTRAATGARRPRPATSRTTRTSTTCSRPWPCRARRSSGCRSAPVLRSTARSPRDGRGARARLARRERHGGPRPGRPGARGGDGHGAAGGRHEPRRRGVPARVGRRPAARPRPRSILRCASGCASWRPTRSPSARRPGRRGSCTRSIASASCGRRSSCSSATSTRPTSPASPTGSRRRWRTPRKRSSRAGHAICLERPDEFAGVVDAFLERATPRGP